MGTTSTAMRQPGGGVRSSTAFAVAIGLHLLALVFIPEFRASIRAAVQSSGDLVEVEAEPAPPPPPPEERPAPRPRVQPTVAPPDTPPPSNEPPPRQAETIEEIPELMANPLSNAGWSVQQGTGTAEAPVRTGVQSDRNVEGAPVGVPEGTGSTGPVPASDLSTTARPPSGLGDSLLQRFYPANARQQAASGRVTVAVDVNADGSIRAIRRVRVVPQPDEFGFLDACSRAIRTAGNWEPGRDRSGSAVRSVHNFTCIFDVNR